MKTTSETLFKLLPSIYRIRDAERDGVLEALVSLLAEQGGIVEKDIARLYENWFIETCDEWVVPYIGDLLGVRGLHSLEDMPYSHRARVANTIRYRRRKGTATVLEQLALDTTGWRSRVVEFFELLGWAQNVNHVRAHSVRTPDLRQTNQLQNLDKAFDSAAHTVDVRHIASGRGRHNIPNIGVYLWRIESYPLARAEASSVGGNPGRFRFDPLAFDTHLFNQPEPEETITHLAEEVNVPSPLRRRALYDELEAWRQALADGAEFAPVFFDDDYPPFRIFVDGSSTPIAHENVLICNLNELSGGDWRRPPATKTYQKFDRSTSPPTPVVDNAGQPVTESRDIAVAVDPKLGRIAFRDASPPSSVRVSFSYGFSGDLGGGSYDRNESLATLGEIDWQVGVSKEHTSVDGENVFDNISAAIDEWNKQPPKTKGLIVVMDNSTYAESLRDAHRVMVPETSCLAVVAAGWPVHEDANGKRTRPKGRFDADGVRPHLRGDLTAEGSSAGAVDSPGELVVSGLLIEGEVAVYSGNLGRLHLAHCTVDPRDDGLEVKSNNARLRVEVIRSICGRIRLPLSVPQLCIEDSILDRTGGKAISADASSLVIERGTVFGRVEARYLTAANSIFNDRVTIERRQKGCVRFSYVKPESKTPRRYRCQPDLAARDADPADVDTIRSRLVPVYTSETYGEYAYGQLGRNCAVEIYEGAEDGSEMGAFSFLKQPQREANLRASLDEYLRIGMEAGLLYVT
jgi:hypothetical protein